MSQDISSPVALTLCNYERGPSAHLGFLGGSRGLDTPNQQGLLLQQLINRCDLYVVSLSCISEGPQYTSWNSQTQTSVDYIIGCLQASQFISRCFTHKLSRLNTSDHLPISTVLRIPVGNCRQNQPQPHSKIDWSKARNSRHMGAYQELVSSVVHPLLGKMYNSPEHLDSEIISVSQQLVQAAHRTLPTLSHPKK